MTPDAPNRSLNRWALWTTVGLLALLAAGAAVNALGATLSVPDWPLSYGRVLPFNFTGNAVHEQTHRILAAACLVLTIGLALAARRHERRGWVRSLAFSAATLYLVQVLAGGFLVLLLAPPWLSALHSILAQIAFVLVFVVVLATSKSWADSAADCGGPPRLSAILLGAAFLQIALGATARHPPAGESLFVPSLLSHLVLAFIVLGLAIAMVVVLRRRGAVRKLRATAIALLALVVIQIAVGLPLFVVSPEPGADEFLAPRSFSYLHIAHVVLAALVFAHAAAIRLRSAGARGGASPDNPSSGSPR